MSRWVIGLFFIVFLGAALWLAPDRLAAIGIMDRSLASDNALVRETALLEIQIAKIGFGVLAALMAVLAIFAPRLEQSNWYNRIQNEGSGFPLAYEAQQRRLFTVSSFVAFLGLVFAALYLRYGNFTFTPEALAAINREDGVLEATSAIILLVASVMALFIAYRAGWTAIGLFHGFLALLFFAMCGEEVSWGQRYFGFETPDALMGLNVQNEVNLHNMFGYLFDHLFILLFFVWGCVIPAMYWLWRPWRWFQSRIGLPMPSLGLAVAMLLVTLTQEQLTDRLIGTVTVLRVPELREFLSAICFLLMMTESRALLASRQEEAVPASSRRAPAE